MKPDDIIYSVHLIQNKILAPVIYLSEYEDKCEFICLCADSPADEELFNLGEELTKILDIPVEVVDILEYDAEDRANIALESELVYTEDPFIERFLAAGISEEIRCEREECKNMITRKDETGSIYLQ